MQCLRTHTRVNSRRPGFTIVELLVVLGAIGLLLALLLPALSAARRAARNMTCTAQQREIARGMLGRSADRGGYLPLAGMITVRDVMPPVNGLAPLLNDADRRRYDYLKGTAFSSPTGESMLPTELSVIKWLDNSGVPERDADVAGWLDQGGREGVRSMFDCPEVSDHGTPKPSVALTVGNETTISLHATATDYGFNEGVLGFDYRDSGVRRLRGKLTSIADPSRTLLLGDMGSRPNLSSVMTWRPPLNAGPGQIPLSTELPDLSGTGVAPSFDLYRHAGKINLAMADGHVETRRIDADDLSRTWLLAQ